METIVVDGIVSSALTEGAFRTGDKYLRFSLESKTDGGGGSYIVLVPDSLQVHRELLCSGQALVVTGQPKLTTVGADPGRSAVAKRVADYVQEHLKGVPKAVAEDLQLLCKGQQVVITADRICIPAQGESALPKIAAPAPAEAAPEPKAAPAAAQPAAKAAKAEPAKEPAAAAAATGGGSDNPFGEK